MPHSHLSGRLRWRASVADTAKRTYTVVFERGPNNYSAYCPDVFGCVAAVDGWDEIRTMIREALEFHIELMLEHGEEFPEPTMSIEDAMRFHCDLGEEPGYEEWLDADESPSTEVTVAMVEVEINVAAAAHSEHSDQD